MIRDRRIELQRLNNPLRENNKIARSIPILDTSVNRDVFLPIRHFENENRGRSWRRRSKDRLEGFIWKKHTASPFDLFMRIAVSTIAAWAIGRLQKANDPR
jgi:hypothetical protein